MAAWRTRTMRNSESELTLSEVALQDQYDKFREESGDAYSLVQTKIADYAEFRDAAIGNSDHKMQVNALILRKSTLDTIAFNLERGYLTYTDEELGSSLIASGIDNADARGVAIMELSNKYLMKSLDLYKRGVDRTIVVPSKHITMVRDEDLSAEAASTKRTFESIVANGLESLKEKMRAIGSAAIELSGVTYDSGEIYLSDADLAKTREIPLDKIKEAQLTVK